MSDIVDPVQQPVDWSMWHLCPKPKGGCGLMFEISDKHPQSDLCPECRFKSIRRRGGRSRREKIKTLITRMVAEKRPDQINAPHVSEITAELMQNFDGGVPGFAKQWYQQLVLAMNLNPGSGTVLKAFGDIAKLVKWSTENRSSAPDAADMTDEDIMREIVALMGETMQKHLQTNPEEVEGLIEEDDHDDPPETDLEA